MSQESGSPTDARPDNIAGLPTRIVNLWFIGWMGVGALSIASFALRERVEWLLEWPRKLVVPVDKWVDAAIAWAAEHLDGFFAVIAWVVNQPLLGLRELFAWLPWPVTIGAIVLLAHYCGGWRLALLSLVSLVYMVVVGYWEPAMLTLSMVTVAVPLSVLFALLLGVLSFSYRPVWRVVEPVLDVMQAMPAFAYLVPMLLWFGLTPMLAVLTSAIYAIPPMTRTVVLGFSRVSVEAIESAVMSGSTRSQILWWVRFPMSLPTLLLGLNQTIMAAFALVVFASIVGGTADIGYEVLLRLRKSQFGEALLSGIVITLFAILADRISRGYAARRSVSLGRRGGGYRTQLVVALVAAIGVVVVAEFMPLLRVYPEAWVFYPADALNDAVRWFTAEFFAVTKWIKQKALFFVLFPIRSGLENSVTASRVGLRDVGNGHLELPGDHAGARGACHPGLGLARCDDHRLRRRALLLRDAGNAMARLHRHRHSSRVAGGGLAHRTLQPLWLGLHAAHRDLGAGDAVGVSLRGGGNRVLPSGRRSRHPGRAG